MLVWPIYALMLAITANMVIRGFRKAAELRSRRQPLTVTDSQRKPSDEFHDEKWLPLCQSVAEAACQHLNRPLTAQERRAIWCSRAPLILEVSLKEIRLASSAGEVAALLASLPPGMDRPDPTGWNDITNTG
ncbi:MAG: hypothetical protein ABSH22_04505 [Tepidisphaeraceae bacterium]|jgi:hypothetical protein